MAKAFKITTNIRVSTKIGVATMGDTVLASDVLRPQILRGLADSKKIELTDAEETTLGLSK